ncbi:Predicted peroxiredoxin [Nocardioides exalbidus]|uniref:Predicted peroxiredoxin n=1 Tax=Nocardioides exalbidus TaxID=402596 RepID=A0A1H4LJG5_9ACTN|nr:DsrE family protein [Nocardioides exalbidus]SEB70791.1 Predicted peroxiredoxin [Nocardioides exalbidus]
MARSLVVKVTCGSDDAERCNQAFTVAAAAAAAGAEVSLWLTGEAAWFGVPGRAESFALDLATPLDQLMAAVLTSGTITVCSQCAARRGITEGDLRDGVTIAGAAVFAEQVLGDGVQALVY